MADYFDEMGWQPLGEGESPNHLLHLARFLRDFNRIDEMYNERLPPPASKTFVENLDNVKITETGQQCPVCLKEHERGELAKKLPCNHLYHGECIDPWLSRTNSCPLCRFELPTDDEEYEACKKAKIRTKDNLETIHNSMFS